MNTINNIFKTTFSDGTTHFFRVPAARNKTPKSYIAYQYSTYKHNISNPSRSHNVTEFETRVAQELNTLKCELVFTGSVEECKAERDRLVRITPNCMNFKASINDTTGKMGKVTTLQLKAEKVKTITSTVDGSKMFFIEREYGHLRGLGESMIGKKHPLYPNYIQIVGYNIEKI